MLNKELFMVGDAAPKGHILMTVGQTLADKKVGWNSYDPMGSVNMVPYWRIGSYICAFDALYYNLPYMNTRCALTSNNQDEFPSRWELRITIGNSSYKFIFTGAYLSISSFAGDVYNLEARNGQTLAVTFDPPRRLHAAKVITIDIGIGYYVEEALLEALYAE